MRWPEGPPHLALNVFFPFLSLLFNTQKTCFPPIKGQFLIVSVSRSFSLSHFWPPPFSVSLSLSLSLSIYLSLSLSLFLSLLSFFLPSCLSFLLSFCSLFLSLPCLFFLLCFCFMKGTTSKYSIAFFLYQYLSLFGFLSCFFFPILFLSLFFFPDFKLCFLFNMNIFGSKTNNLNNTIFW